MSATKKMTDTMKMTDTKTTVGSKGLLGSKGQALSALSVVKKFPPSKTDKLIALLGSEDESDMFTVFQIREIYKDHFKKEYEKSLTAREIIPFGKYKGRKVLDVASFDKDYLRWLFRQTYVKKYVALYEELTKLF